LKKIYTLTSTTPLSPTGDGSFATHVTHAVPYQTISSGETVMKFLESFRSELMAGNSGDFKHFNKLTTGMKNEFMKGPA